MNPTDQNIRVTPDLLRNLIVAVGKGEYRIPQFQREFVWEKNKVVQLFDSIYKEYPIGSFFLWKAGRQHNNLFRHSIDLGIHPIHDDDDIYFILDGQQRITSVYLTLMGRIAAGMDYSRICFDVKDEKFTYRDSDPKRFIPVCDIWSKSILEIAKHVDESWHEALSRCDQVLRTYPISIVEVRDKDLPDVCTIFQRINQGGKRLDRFDLIAAMTFSTDFDLRERFREDLSAKLQLKSFGAISPTVVTQLMALLKKGACTERVEFSLTGPENQEMWKGVVDAVLLAADTLRKALGVQNARYLPYEAILTLLAYAFFRSNRRSLSDNELQWVKKWFWKSSFGQHYGAAAPTKMGRDKDLFDKLLNGEAPAFDPPMFLTAESLVGTKMTWSRSAIRNAFLCLLAQRNPVHLANNSQLDLVTGGISDFTNPEKHHIFPQAYLRGLGFGEDTVFALPNFCFVPSELNKKILDASPSRYIAELKNGNPHFTEAASIQLIPTDSGSGLDTDDYELFLRARSELILEEIESVTGVSTSTSVSHHKAIEEIEDAIRDLIHDKLSSAIGGEYYWGIAIPDYVREEMISRAVSETRKNPEANSHNVNHPREILNYCTLFECDQIILRRNNWPHFEPVFRRRDDFRIHLNGLCEFIQSESNNTPIEEPARRAFELALVWFKAVLPSRNEIPIQPDSDEQSASSQV
jgi:hypothetical protein